MTKRSRLIVALDVNSHAEMVDIVDATQEHVGIYKIGQQLFTAEGPRVIEYLKNAGKDVFLDVKLHEIPNSVASAVRSAGRHGVNMLTVHASGGVAMMQAAVDAAAEFAAMKVLAVTVVTGLNDADLGEIGFAHSCEKQVMRLARLAQQAACHGLIASSQETAKLRAAKLKKAGQGDMLIVTPGIRPVDAEANDQSRIGTPSYAIRSGASHIIVGRPIVQADDPAAVAREINERINRASE